ncbi:MAG: hypothetical protein FGM36_12985 [Burkholderiaceae bacterium]|nr:hypothetical protein [Burkholderiaceae bacterium]
MIQAPTVAAYPMANTSGKPSATADPQATGSLRLHAQNRYSIVQYELCAFEEEIQFVVGFVFKVSLTASNACFEVNPARPRYPAFHLSARPRTIS